jgi:uroporphyrinogen decarboxylase
MDMAEPKADYGDRLIFHGAVEKQKVIPYGTAQEVREEVLHRMATLGKGQEGYICCSCHDIQPGTPFENVLTLVDTAKNNGTSV